MKKHFIVLASALFLAMMAINFSNVQINSKKEPFSLEVLKKAHAQDNEGDDGFVGNEDNDFGAYSNKYGCTGSGSCIEPS